MRIRHVFPAALVLAVVAGAAGPAAHAASASGQLSSVPSATHSKSRQLEVSAAKTESDAYLQYTGYADSVVKDRRPDLAQVWRTVGEVEHQDHWTHEVTLAGLYSGSDNVANLRTAITQAQQAAQADTDWAANAPKDSAAAAELRTVAARETADAGLLKRALTAEQGKGSMPAAPPVHTIPIQVSAGPHYSGSFYNDLTGDSNSALQAAAWNWAEYQFDAKTAVDTGQANLAALFSGLEAQEQYENWAGLSNAAGYVNSDAANLKASIASEQGAITMYTQYAGRAKNAGDTATAAAFLSIRGDEMSHHQTFLRELDAGR
ncbi:ferritin family protein [Streptomyces sp. NPDC002619]|uniref:ferritin family protein n=1 Tax=Streptomyces sp. NPDC002619 TaxID=3364655 RepID=UPI003686D62C